MENNQNTLNKQRSLVYRFLSRLYLQEVDQATMEALKQVQFPKDCGNEDLDEGYALMAKAIDAMSEAGLEELASDYAAIFLSAGVAQGLAAFPCESVYTSKKRLVMQGAAGDVIELYSAKGLKPSDQPFMVPPDHVGLELEFMARLCDEDQVDEEKAFFDAHISNWVPTFAADVIKYAKTDFYKSLGKITKGFIAVEETYLCNCQEVTAS